MTALIPVLLALSPQVDGLHFVWVTWPVCRQTLPLKIATHFTDPEGMEAWVELTCPGIRIKDLSDERRRPIHSTTQQANIYLPTSKKEKTWNDINYILIDTHEMI